jgi:hypothetical protein
MRNTLDLPILALIVAAILAIAVAISAAGEGGTLTELELGGIAWALGLAVYGVQGLISILLEGRELHLGRALPRMTSPLSAGIALFSLALLAIAVLLAIALTNDWDVEILGLLAGGGCLVLAALVVFYKEAFVGDETTLDNRDDGIPW